MIKIQVCRGSSFIGECQNDDPLLNWGSDISEALLSVKEDTPNKNEPALERGRVEIDKAYSNRTEQTLLLHQTSFIQPGSIIRTVVGTDVTNGVLRNISIKYQKGANAISTNSTIGIEQNV